MNRFDGPPELMPAGTPAAGVVEAGKTCDDFAKETVGQIFDAAAPAPAPEVNHGP